MDVASKFVGQVRRAFEGSGPRPIYNITKSKRRWLLGEMVRLETEIVPQVFYPIPKIEDFMSIRFQNRVNELLLKNPISLSGTVNIRFKVKEGQYARISNVEWLVEVYKINKLDMNKKGVVSVSQFEFRTK